MVTPTPPIQISDHDWKALQQVLQDCIPQTTVCAFGSRARGTAKPYSDLDIALLGEGPVALDTLAQLSHALETSDMTVRTDVVDWASVSEQFRRIIAADRVVIHPVAAEAAPTSFRR